MARATSIISTSGAGVPLEARIAAVYLSALLVEAGGPGDEPASIIVGVDFQRTDPAAGFDDLHIHHRQPTGAITTTYLQIKRTLSGSRSDNAFRRPVGDAARMLKDGTNAEATFRIIASQSAFFARDVDRARAAAILSTDADDFWRRWNAPGASSNSEREFTSAVAWVVEQEFKNADPGLAWQVICRLGILELDADQAGSQAVSYAIDRLQGSLHSGSRAEAVQLFETICQFAEDASKVSGGVDRSRLLGALAPRYRLNGSPSARGCLERIKVDAIASLNSIRNDIAGVKLDREDLSKALATLMRENRGVKLGGEAGTGKSAVLRNLAERLRADGVGLIVLKHDRLTAMDWSSHAAILQLTTPLRLLVEELAAGGSGLLVIDGFDRIMEAGLGGLVHEVCEAISRSASAPLWRCLVSSRDAGGPEPALAIPLLQEIQPLEVGAPSSQDLEQLKSAFPHLGPLIARKGFAELNRNLFFIDQMARNPSDAGASSELDLMRAWAGRGGSEAPRHPSRDAVLRELGEMRLSRPYKPLPKPQDEDALNRLVSERTITIPAYRDVLTFTHDIYEEWAIARALDARREEIPAILKAADQPLVWMRAIRLVAEIALESEGPDGWRAFHDLLSEDQALDPLWRRLTLTAMLHSPRAASMLDRLEPTLLEADAKLLHDLIETLLSLEVQPHPVILHSPQFDDLTPDHRRRLAQSAALPRIVPWIAFLDWSADRWAAWPKALVPELARVTLTWLRLNLDGMELNGKLVRQCLTWLRELEDIEDMPFDDWDERRRLRSQYGDERSGSSDPLRDRLRHVVATGVREAAEEIDAYLAGLLASGRRRGTALLEAPGTIPSILPRRFVDLVIAAMIMPHDPEAPLDYSVEQNNGISDMCLFFPSSPTRAGCDLLFAADENEALRLLDALSGAAAAVWRRREARRGRTARPLSLSIGDVTAQLWGDEHVYKWSRGLLGSNLLGSLFLAADQWMIRQIAAGRSLSELSAKLLASSHLVASASICLAAAKDRAGRIDTLEQILPFIVKPRLWRYDLRLSLDDQSGSAFRIGWRSGDEHAYRAAWALQMRRSRQHHLVDGLIAPLHSLTGRKIKGAEALNDALACEVDRWSVEDIASFDDELDYAPARTELEEELQNWRAKADPANWEITRDEEDNIWAAYKPPLDLLDRAKEATERNEEINASGQLLDWAFGHVTAGTTRRGQTFLEALPVAKEMDSSDLFDHALEVDVNFSLRSKGVAAVAAAVAKYGTDELITSQRDWLLSVFYRAVGIDHAGSPFHYESTQLNDDPAASAARGLGALTMRGLGDEDTARVWMELAGDPFRDIAKAALEPAAAFASQDPVRANNLFYVSSMSMLYQWQAFDADFELRMRETRCERVNEAIDRALEANARGEFLDPVCPDPIEMSFIAGDARNPCAGDPENQFDAYRAGSVWADLDVTGLAKVPQLRDRLVAYSRAALCWYASFLEFQNNEGSYGTTRHRDWEARLGRICGRLAVLIPSDECIEKLITPASAIPDGETRSSILAFLLDAMADRLYDDDLPLDDSFEATWRAACEPIFVWADHERTRHYDPDETPLSAAAFALYGSPAFAPNWPRAGEIGGLLDEWVANCAGYRFAARIILALIKQAGDAFVPIPGLNWLERIVQAHEAGPAEHWQSEMGRSAGEALHRLWTRSEQTTRRLHIARFRSMAARLADLGVVAASDLLSDIAAAQAKG